MNPNVRFSSDRTYTVRLVQAPSRSEMAFREAFDAHFDAVNRYCLRRIDAADVNDVVAEVFVVAWRKIDQMPDGGDALPWLYGVARNEIRNSRRARGRRQSLRSKLGGLAQHADPGPESVVVRHEQLDQLMAAVASLRPADQEILLLRTQEELDYRQIGIAIDASPEAARKRLNRAISRLRIAAGVPAPSTGKPTPRAIEEGGDR